MQSRQTKNFILLAVLLTVNLLLLYALPDKKEPMAWQVGYAESLPQTIQKITIQGPKDSVGLVVQGKNWFVDVDPPIKANNERIEDLIDIFKHIECSAQTFSGDPQEYGLHNPTRVISFTGARNLVVKVGDPTPSQMSDYVYCLGAIRRTKTVLHGRIPVDIDYYRESLLQSFQPQNIDSVLFEDGIQIRKEYGIWKQVHPHTVFLDSTQVEAWLRTLSRVHLDSFEHKAMMRDQHQLVLKEGPSDVRYTWADNGDVKSTDQSAGNLNDQSIALLSKNPASFYSSALYVHHAQPTALSFYENNTEIRRFEDGDLAFETFFTRLGETNIERQLLPLSVASRALNIYFQDGSSQKFEIAEHEDVFHLYSQLEDVVIVVPHHVLEGFY